jgi:lipid-A-disaccharide synthase-like uncharacterized protein
MVLNHGGYSVFSLKSKKLFYLSVLCGLSFFLTTEGTVLFFTEGTKILTSLRSLWFIGFEPQRAQSFFHRGH